MATRAQAEKQKKPLKPLKIATGAVHEISTDDLIEAKAEDHPLKKLWELTRKGKDMRQQRYRKNAGKAKFAL